MAIYVMRTAEDGYYWATMFGMKIEPRGSRFPTAQLRARLEEYGHTLDSSDYEPASSKPKVDPVYRITAPVRIRSVGRPSKNGNGANVRIERKVVEMPLSKIRDLTEKRGRGKPGNDAALQAAVIQEGWDVSDARSVRVERLKDR